MSNDVILHTEQHINVVREPDGSLTNDSYAVVDPAFICTAVPDSYSYTVTLAGIV